MPRAMPVASGSSSSSCHVSVLVRAAGFISALSSAYAFDDLSASSSTDGRNDSERTSTPSELHVAAGSREEQRLRAVLTTGRHEGWQAIVNAADDGDTAVSFGDTLTVTFDAPTDRGAGPSGGSRTFVDDLFRFEPAPASDYSGEWADDSTFVVTVLDAAGVSVQYATSSSALAVHTSSIHRQQRAAASLNLDNRHRCQTCSSTLACAPASSSDALAGLPDA